MDFQPLTNFQINEYFKTDKSFKGAVAKDILPKKFLKNTSYIVNFDNFGGPGSHWVAIYNKLPKYVVYFDSFGLAPPLRILKFLRTTNKKIVRNDLTIQQKDSIMCGYYAIDLIERLNKGESLIDILYDYEHDPNINERIIKKSFPAPLTDVS